MSDKSTSVFLGKEFANHAEVEQYVALVDQCGADAGQVLPGMWYIQGGGDGKPYIWRPDNNGVYAWLPFVDMPKASDIVGLAQLTTEQINNAIANLKVDVTQVTNFSVEVLNQVAQAFVNGDTTQVIVTPDGKLQVEVVPCSVQAKELCDHPIHPSAQPGSVIVTLDVLQDVLKTLPGGGVQDFKASVICRVAELPADAPIGARYLLTTNGKIMDFNGLTWAEDNVTEGSLVFVECETKLYIYHNDSWFVYSTGTNDHEALTGLLGGDPDGHYHLTKGQLDCLVALCAMKDTIVTQAYLSSQLEQFKYVTGSGNPDGCLVAQLENQDYLQLINLTIGGKAIAKRRHFVSESAGANRWFLLN
jgi:hypothetical protein